MTVAVGKQLTIGPWTFIWGERTYIMGVINVSPESFWSGTAGEVDATLGRARRLVDDGADIVDVGGQSTRPGFDELGPQEEIERVVPVIERLTREVEVAVSVDTYKAPVARAALAAGAHLVNDIWGFRHDEAVASLCVEFAVPAVIMHNQRGREFHDVIGDIRAGLEASIAIGARAGLQPDQLIIDPGFGFGWIEEQNIEMLRRLRELHDLGLPVLLGTSRKSTIGAVLGGKPPEERLHGTSATTALAVAAGVDIVRVHDVTAARDVTLVADAVVRGWRKP
jgi:dihydropteroate synthase